MKNKHYKNMVFAAMCLALALTLPFFTGQNQELGNMLALMHIPVLLCGFICGPVWGTVIGATAPLLRSFIFTKPPFPGIALPMAFELAVYGLLTGLLYRILPKKIQYIYISLLGAMLGGRIVWGIAKTVLTVASSDTFTFSLFIANGFAVAIPGIIIQIVLIPLIVLALKKAKIISGDIK